MIKAQGQSTSGVQLVLIAFFALIVGLSGLLTVMPLDRDESRFIQATTQMIETGDYVSIKFQDSERNKKPVGIYWLQALSVHALADVEDRPLWAYRVPSLIGAILAALFTYMAGATLFGRTPAMMAAMLLATAPVLAGEASIAKTDASLLAAICGMQAALVRLLTAKDTQKMGRTVYAFWIALGAGVLIKGPVAPMVLFFTLLGLWFWLRAQGQNPRDMLRRLRLRTGFWILCVMLLPWLIAIGIVTEGRFFVEALGGDMLGKVATVQERHDGWPGYHLIAMCFMFWPAILFVPAALRYGFGHWRDGRIAFLLAWIIPVWLVFELSSTKLPHYGMVIYPALALLIGLVLGRRQFRDYRLYGWLGALLYTSVGAVAACAIIILARTFSSEGVVVWHYVAAGGIGVVTLIAASLTILSRPVAALTMAIIASSTFAWVTFEGILPTLDRLALTPRLAQMLDENEAHPLKDDTGPVALVGYYEPSAVFTLGTDSKLLNAQAAAVWISAAKGRAAVVEEREVQAFFAALPPSVKPVEIASIEGFNYSNNKDMRLILFRLAPVQ